MNIKKDISAAVESDCLQAMDHLYAYLNGELDNQPEKFSIVEHHLGHCRSCFSRAEMERLLNKHIKESGRAKTPDTLKARLRKLMDKF